MIKPTTLSEQLLFNTVRIETQIASGEIRTGTGFFFSFHVSDNKEILAIITNKHVVKDAIIGRFQVHESEMEDGEPKPSGRFFSIEIDNFTSQWIPHPNNDIDLSDIFEMNITDPL